MLTPLFRASFFFLFDKFQQICECSFPVDSRLVPEVGDVSANKQHPPAWGAAAESCMEAGTMTGWGALVQDQ